MRAIKLVVHVRYVTAKYIPSMYYILFLCLTDAYSGLWVSLFMQNAVYFKFNEFILLEVLPYPLTPG